MWVMKDYGVPGSWTKVYHFNAQVTKCLLDYRTLACYRVIRLKTGEFLVQYGPKDFGYYDAEQQSCRPILMPLHTSDRCNYLLPVFLVGSLFSPKNLCGLGESTQMRITEEEEEEKEIDISVKDKEVEEIDRQGLQEMTGDFFSMLPSDIILDILCRIPVKSLSSQCRLVCKSWFSLIRNPSFAKFHYEWAIQNCCSPCVILGYCGGDYGLVDHQVFDTFETSAPVHYLDFLKKPEFEEGLEVIGFVNGLLCFSENPYHCSYPVFYYICNPITGEHLALPRACKLHPVEVSAFGFDSTTNEYKVIRFYYDRNEGEVFTLGSSRWRRIQISVPKRTCRLPYGMLVNNHLHWISHGDGEPWISCGDDEPLTIVAFDMAAEEIHKIETPLLSLDRIILGVIEERLCLFGKRNFDDSYCEIWVMKEYGVQGSWAKDYLFFNPEVHGCLSKFSSAIKLRNGEFLVEFGDAELCYFAPSKETCRPIVLNQDDEFSSIFFLVGSLFSPLTVVCR